MCKATLDSNERGYSIILMTTKENKLTNQKFAISFVCFAAIDNNKRVCKAVLENNERGHFIAPKQI